MATYSGDANNIPLDTACGDPGETVEVVDVLPVIDVVKTADPLELPEPGGLFTFDVVVTNNSVEPVTITSLTDNVYGDIATQGTCTTAVGTVLAAAPGPGNTGVGLEVASNPAGRIVWDLDGLDDLTCASSELTNGGGLWAGSGG
ncbi:hypothetical protein BH18ACT4_BH18ACT4_12470 [soil metagenome]